MLSKKEIDNLFKNRACSWKSYRNLQAHLVSLAQKRNREKKWVGKEKRWLYSNIIRHSRKIELNPSNVMKPLVFIFSLSSSFPVLPPSFAPVAFSFLSPALHQEYHDYEAWFPHYNWYPLADWHSAWRLSSLQLVCSSSLSLIIPEDFTPNFRYC